MPSAVCIGCGCEREVPAHELAVTRCGDCGAELVSMGPPGGDVPQATLGRFTLMGELGRGGMGVVHRAWDERLGRMVALKTLVAGAGDANAVARFEREARAVARLRHPNIVAVHDVGVEGATRYLAMDLIEGATLAQRLADPDGKLPLTKALEALRDVARAVHHAHGERIVHRDLKPQNIMIDPAGRAVVLDFGLAAIRGAEDKITRTGSVMGTPAYMSPEQAASSGEVDGRSDVYSLGATLYHVLTGRPPFEGAHELNVLLAVTTKDPAPPGALNPRARGDLETITLRCLEKDPARRYPDAAALADDLDRYLAGDPIVARPLSRGARAWRWAKRRPLAVLALATVLGATSTALVAVERARRPARLRAEALALIALGDYDEAAARLDAARALGDDDRTAWILLHEARAVAALSTDELVAARVQLSESLRLGGRNAQLWVALARAHNERNELPAAMKAAEQALRLDPEAVAATQLRGLCLLRLDRLREALPEVERALTKAPRDQSSWIMVSELGHHDHAAANELFRRFLDEAERPPMIGLVVRARFRDGIGDRRGALADLDRAVRLAPERLDLRETRAKVRMRFGDLRGALQDLEAVVAEGAPSYDVLSQRAGIRRALGDHDGALQDATAALDLWDSPGTRLLRGLTRLELGDREGAIDDFSSALARDRSSALARFARARARVGLGDLEGARADLEELLRLAPDSHLARDATELLDELGRRTR